MSRPLRFIPPGSMVEVTTRVMQGRFLLVPSDDLKEIVLGVLGRALTMYAVQLHAFIFLSNHYELLLSVPDAVVLAGFMNFVNSNLAREIGRMHGWREKIWGRRYRSIPIVDEESQVARLRYLLSNGCKEGLVASPREWPGASSLPALLDGQPLHRVWFDRSAEYRARKRGEQPTKYAHASRYDVPLTPLPCWANLSIEEHRRHCAELVADIEAETRLARAASGRPPLGVNALQQQHPHARPARLSHSPAPWCHASCKEHRHRFKDAYAGFVRAFRQATRVLRDLVPRIEFPPHCFPPMLAFVGSGRS